MSFADLPTVPARRNSAGGVRSASPPVVIQREDAAGGDWRLLYPKAKSAVVTLLSEDPADRSNDEIAALSRSIDILDQLVSSLQKNPAISTM